MQAEEKKALDLACDQFRALMEKQLERAKKIKEDKDFTDYQSLDKIVIGICGGDGIGPIITKESQRVIEFLLKDEVEQGKIEFKVIDGLTIENRAAHNQAIPDDVLAELKQCHVILKGPTTTPRQGDPWPNVESANVAMRKELDLFANMRPVKVPEEGIDWTFFRENIEGEYIWGDKGIQVNEDLAVDFKVQTKQGSERIARAAFEFAKRNGKKNVTVVTKANIVKLVDGNFAKTVHEVGKDYPGIEVQERLVDAMCAKMLDPEFNEGIEVVVLPNLYGDIVTDVAAELSGGLGTACSSNIGDKYALFEAIHGTAPYLISHDRGDYANPSSLIRAVGQMLMHIGYGDRAKLLDDAMEICTVTEKKVVVTTQKEDASAAEFTDYLLETIQKIR